MNALWYRRELRAPMVALRVRERVPKAQLTAGKRLRHSANWVRNHRRIGREERGRGIAN